MTYTYDGDGKRISKSNGKLYWYGTGSDPITETDAGGNSPVEYVFFSGKRIARRDAAGAVAYDIADHLGSAREVVSSAGTLLDDSDFYPFGGERPTITPTSGNTYKFTGKERDTESGLDDFGARYYSSTLGRWLSPDWSATPTAVPYADLTDPQTLNLYGYLRGNPLLHEDADGHCCKYSVSSVADWVTEKLQTGAALVGDAAVKTGNGYVAGATTFAAGMTNDIVGGIVDSFKAGDSVGACLDSCNAVDLGDAIGQDLGRTAGLVDLAAGAAGALPETGETSNAPATKASGTPGHGENTAAQYGREVHRNYNPGEGYDKKVTFPSGRNLTP